MTHCSFCSALPFTNEPNVEESLMNNLFMISPSAIPFLLHVRKESLACTLEIFLSFKTTLLVSARPIEIAALRILKVTVAGTLVGAPSVRSSDAIGATDTS
eukprot:CAMPEP_0179119344 /NCGR_PEP_ID=MMETSP0796-20121207/56176_1 /TAXON_ID=73915 /ORGANISM="Pyrodinium bahamense, Strain pbaha01" /LENGTH=100 /DNA_ID=CAMNT_0020817841 /DNA_START=132 /DNA_END=431 /DNA_ORIENTATION=-